MPTWVWVFGAVSSLCALITVLSTLVNARESRKSREDSQKSRGDMLQLKADILELMNTRLVSYVTVTTFQQYSESHAKEHLDMIKEIDRLREWKHEHADAGVRYYPVVKERLDKLDKARRKNRRT